MKIASFAGRSFPPSFCLASMGLIPNKLRRRSLHLQAIPIKTSKTTLEEDSNPSSLNFPLPLSATTSSSLYPRNSIYSPSSLNTFVTSPEEPVWDWQQQSNQKEEERAASSSINSQRPLSLSPPDMNYQPSSPNRGDYNSQHQQQPQQQYGGGGGVRPQSQQYPSYGQGIQRPHSGQGSINSQYQERERERGRYTSSTQQQVQALPHPAPPVGSSSQTSSPSASTPSFQQQQRERPNSQMFSPPPQQSTGQPLILSRENLYTIWNAR